MTTVRKLTDEEFFSMVARRLAVAGRDVIDHVLAAAQERGEEGIPIVYLDLANAVASWEGWQRSVKDTSKDTD